MEMPPVAILYFVCWCCVVLDDNSVSLSSLELVVLMR